MSKLKQARQTFRFPRKCKESQWTCNVTFWRLCTIQPLLPWKSKKYYILRVFVCSLRYSACNVHTRHVVIFGLPNSAIIFHVIVFFKISPCCRYGIFSSGYFPGVWILKADVSEHSVNSIWYVLFWVFPRRLYIRRRRFGSLCHFHLVCFLLGISPASEY
jgi:hypothetical protein